MKISSKIFIALLAGTISLIALVQFYIFTKTYFQHRQEITAQLDAIKLSEHAFVSYLLESSLFLYHSQDEANRRIQELKRSVDTLLKHPHINETIHANSIQTLQDYRAALDEMNEALHDFQTASITIKNATLAIETMQKNLHHFNNSNPKEHELMHALNDITTLLLFSKGALDAALLDSLKKQIAQAEKIGLPSTEKQQFVVAFLRNAKVFEEYFPYYSAALYDLQHSKTKMLLAQWDREFSEENQKEMGYVTQFSYLLLLLYISSIAIIIYFLIDAEHAATTDKLTNLKNRKYYEAYIGQNPNSALMLININRFKYYNDFYGIGFGDKLLIFMAQQLQKYTKKDPSLLLFRFGADEFGILSREKNTLEELSSLLLPHLQNTTVHINAITLSISASIAISDVSPQLETADMALKTLKKNRKQSTIIYNKALNLNKLFSANITKTQELLGAIEQGELHAHFQPIYSFATNKIEKFETLARIRGSDGTIKSIYEYLDVLKESKHYHTLTKTTIEKSCEIMHGKTEFFSINLSIEDINDAETLQILEAAFARYPHIAPRLIFEILESEAVNDYGALAHFIGAMKRHGCQIAIDDFGSGYSNFAHILNLDIDIIKIDGTLIRDIATNPSLRMIVETIVSFAKKANIKTVAEFVYNEAVYNCVKEVGIDFAQGYYTGKPEPIEQHVIWSRNG